MRLNKILVFITLLNLIMILVTIQISAEYATANIGTSSFIMSETTGNLVHYQIDSSEVREVWRADRLFESYDHFVVDDITDNGQLEIVAVMRNRQVDLLDFLTGEIIWTADIGSLTAYTASIMLIDLQGDGQKEIIVYRNAPDLPGYIDNSLMILDNNGELLDSIITPLPTYQRGANTIEIVDFNGDGAEEMLLSYGSTLWNGTIRKGRYSVQHWEWDVNNKRMKNLWTTEGEDRGGNTQLKVHHAGSDSLIFTSGWYNNEVRAFNNVGELLWEKQLMNSDKDRIVQMADNRITLYDNGEITKLYIYQDNYWYNQTLGWYELDMLSGEIVNTVQLFKDSRHVRLYPYQDKIIVHRLLNVTDFPSHSTEIELYDLNSGEYLGSYRHENNHWGNMLRTSSNPIIDINQNIPSFFALDKQNRLWITSLESEFLVFTIPIISIAWFEVIDYPELEGSLINSFTNFYALSSLIIILINVIFVSSYFFKRYYSDNKFHASFGQNWKINAYIRLKQIFLKDIPQLKSIGQEALFDVFDNQEINQVAPEKTSESFTNFLNIWLIEHGNEANKIKAGDIAILIEFLDVDLDSVAVNEILKKFSHFNSSTFYRRIGFLVGMNLLNEVGITEDQRSKIVEITVYGIEFLKTMFSSMSFYFN